MEAGSPGGGHCRDPGERWGDTEGLDWRINVLEVLVVLVAGLWICSEDRADRIC